MRRFVPWLVWVVAVLGSFAGMESRALRKRDIPTLSEALAYWLGCHPRQRHAPVTIFGFFSFWVWLTVHVYRYLAPGVDTPQSR